MSFASRRQQRRGRLRDASTSLADLCLLLRDPDPAAGFARRDERRRRRVVATPQGSKDAPRAGSRSSTMRSIPRPGRSSPAPCSTTPTSRCGPGQLVRSPADAAGRARHGRRAARGDPDRPERQLRLHRRRRRRACAARRGRPHRGRRDRRDQGLGGGETSSSTAPCCWSKARRWKCAIRRRGELMSLPELCIRRPVMTSLLMLSFIVFGLFGYRQLPVSALPRVDFPTVAVMRNCRAPARIRWPPRSPGRWSAPSRPSPASR